MVWAKKEPKNGKDINLASLEDLTDASVIEEVLAR